MEFPALVFTLFFVFLFLVSIIELILIVFAVSGYFQSGLPLISRTYAIPSPIPLADFTERLQEHFPRNFWHSAILFWPLSENECAFRPVMFEWRWGFRLRPWILGTIKQIPEENKVRVVIIWPWTTLLLFVALLILSVVNVTPVISIGGLVYLVVILAIQFWIFAGSADKMAQVVQKSSGIPSYHLPTPIKQPLTSRVNLMEHLEWGAILALAGILPVMVAYLLTLNQVEPVSTTVTHTQPIRRAAFTPDSSSVAFADDGHIFFRRLSDGVIWKQLDTSQTAVTNLVFSPSGRFLVSASADGGIYLWEIVTNTVQQLQPERSTIDEQPAFLFSADDTLVIGAFVDGFQIKYWDTASGHVLATVIAEREESGENPVFSPDGQWVASHGWGGRVMVRRVSDGKLLYILPVVTDGYSMALAFSPDSSLLATGSLDTEVQLWRTQDGTLVRTLRTGFFLTATQDLAFSPDGKWITIATYSSVTTWRVADGRKLYAIIPEATWIEDLLYAPNGQIIAAQSYDSLILWQVEQ